MFSKCTFFVFHKLTPGCGTELLSRENPNLFQEKILVSPTLQHKANFLFTEIKFTTHINKHHRSMNAGSAMGGQLDLLQIMVSLFSNAFWG